ncbi:MAG: chromosomal replication initiator protein DnaA [Negativicutes bacterium]|nr:chromosomal replication initiator protein DnaA [Negativicutes bacterium]
MTDIPANDVDRIWSQIMSLTEKCLPPQVYNTWIAPLIPLSLADGILTVGATNDFTRTRVVNDYGDAIQALAATVCRQMIRFEVINLNLPAAESSNYDEQPLTVTRNHNFGSVTTGNGQMATQPATSLNERFTFETFVVGNSNRAAYSAAMAVAESPFKSYNPLFIYGNVGLGKTHLLHAIGNRVSHRFPGLRLIYVSCEQMTNDFINCLRDRDIISFRSRYRDVDVLIVDDIQFLSGKNQTQEEFFHTFNTLHQTNRQIILTSDKPPKDIEKIEERLVSRFASGLTMDIQPPDLETRIAIVTAKAQWEGIDLPPEVCEYIASNITDNVRELEGALTRLIAYCSFNSQPVSLASAGTALSTVIGKKPRLVNCETIIRQVADYFKLRPEDLAGGNRSKNTVLARQIAMYLCREMIRDLSFPQIGQKFGGKDHSTVMHSYEKISKLMTSDQEIQNYVTSVREKITSDNS